MVDNDQKEFDGICSLASISRGSKFETVGANNPRDSQLSFVHAIQTDRMLCSDGWSSLPRAKYSCLSFSSISSIFSLTYLACRSIFPGPARHLHPLWLEWLTLFTSTALLKENSLVARSLKLRNWKGDGELGNCYVQIERIRISRRLEYVLSWL